MAFVGRDDDQDTYNMEQNVVTIFTFPLSGDPDYPMPFDTLRDMVQEADKHRCAGPRSEASWGIEVFGAVEHLAIRVISPVQN